MRGIPPAIRRCGRRIREDEAVDNRRELPDDAAPILVGEYGDEGCTGRRRIQSAHRVSDGVSSGGVVRDVEDELAPALKSARKEGAGERTGDFAGGNDVLLPESFDGRETQGCIARLMSANERGSNALSRHVVMRRVRRAP